MVNFKFNFTFHNILIYNRATFNNTVACCVDVIAESLQPVEASCNGLRKISVFKIPTNRKTQLTVYAKSWEILVMEFAFSIFKTLTLSTVFFKYLANILQHSTLNGCFHEDSENKTSNVFSLIFAGFYCSYDDVSVNAP